jgi:hypothetical protein
MLNGQCFPVMPQGLVWPTLSPSHMTGSGSALASGPNKPAVRACIAAMNDCYGPRGPHPIQRLFQRIRSSNDFRISGAGYSAVGESTRILDEISSR